MQPTVTHNPTALADRWRRWVVPARRWVRLHRARRAVYWLIVIWTLNFFDVAFTINATKTGRFVEANPLVKDFVIRSELWSIFAYKLMFLLLASWLFVRNRRYWFCELGLAISTLAYLAVSVMWLLHTPEFEIITLHHGP
jgi:hypothetical protein